MRNPDYNRYKELIDDHIMDFMPDIDNKSITLYESMKYSLTAGGKRFRPVLLLATCEFAGGDIFEALPYACAIEYIHTYSLIHDDLPAVDNDDYRRGKLSNHKVYTESIALYAGDGLITSAFELMNKDMMLYFDNTEKLKMRINASYELAKGAGVRGMVAGQVADIEAEDKSCSKELIDYIHTNKTATLIISAIRAGAFIGGAKGEMLDSLTAYGEYLGLLFQMTDDILDITGNFDEMGKNVNVDSKNNKSTYISMYNLDEAKKKAEDLAAKAKECIADYSVNTDFFTDLIDDVLTRKN